MDGILEDREKRYERIVKLAEKYGLPVVCGKVNYPGGDKNTEEAQKAFKILEGMVKSEFEGFIEYAETAKGFDGSSILLAVRLRPYGAKMVAVSIEEFHPGGRVFDIDVYLKDGRPLSREEMGLPQRKCIVCGEDARLCTRSRKHSLVKTLEMINMIIECI